MSHQCVTTELLWGNSSHSDEKLPAFVSGEHYGCGNIWKYVNPYAAHVLGCDRMWVPINTFHPGFPCAGGEAAVQDG